MATPSTTILSELARGTGVVQDRFRAGTEIAFVDIGGAGAADLAMARADIAALLQTNIFCSEEAAGPIFKASYAWLILNLDRMLVALDKAGRRVVLATDDDEDVTEIIRRARYAIVHATVKPRRGLKASGTPNYIVSVGGPSGYDDDIAVDLGGVRVLIRRHAVRAYEAASAALDD